MLQSHHHDLDFPVADDGEAAKEQIAAFFPTCPSRAPSPKKTLWSGKPNCCYPKKNYKWQSRGS